MSLFYQGENEYFNHDRTFLADIFYYKKILTKTSKLSVLEKRQGPRNGSHCCSSLWSKKCLKFAIKRALCTIMADIILKGSFLAVAWTNYIVNFSTNKFFKLYVKTIVIKLSIYLWGIRLDKEIQLQGKENLNHNSNNDIEHLLNFNLNSNVSIQGEISFFFTIYPRHFHEVLKANTSWKLPNPYLHQSKLLIFHICFLKNVLWKLRWRKWRSFNANACPFIQTMD
jgi:hypothetical protein